MVEMCDKLPYLQCTFLSCCFNLECDYNCSCDTFPFQLCIMIEDEGNITFLLPCLCFTVACDRCKPINYESVQSCLYSTFCCFPCSCRICLNLKYK